ncbi:MAG TPA: TonB family protein, partial [Lacunisphaera sp.]|nr:TonB family protein [Lacunisphaera sp.]
IRLAAEAGEVTAQRILATLSFLGFGVPENRSEALRWLEKAAQQDDAAAQFRLGAQVEKSRRGSLRPDVSLARTWYELSAEQEYRASMRAMARTFLQAPRGEQNWEMGFRWLKLAADTGDAEAGFVLAMHELLHVDSPTRDVGQARAWLQVASSRGNVRAREVLELEIGGRTLPDSIRYVLSEPFEERYIRWVNSRIPDREAPTRRPEIYRVVKPIYPQALRFTETRGKVLLEFVIDQTGRVKEAKAVESPHPLFTERALEAVAQWRFHPARVDGRPVNTKARQLMEFSMDSPELAGVDGLLSAARGMAEKLGTVPAADFAELRLAKPRVPLPPLRALAGTAPAPEAKALLLLSLDASGKPVRGYVLDAKPEAIGAVFLEVALRQLYEPRQINGEAVPSNVVLPRVMKPGAPPAKAGL